MATQVTEKHRRTLVWAGLAGCALVGWSIYQLVRGAGCDGVTVACPPDWLPIAITVGLLVAFAASFLTRSPLVMIGIFVGAGVGAAFGGLAGAGEEAREMLFIGLAFVVVALLPLVLITAAVRRKKQRATRLLNEGATAIGTLRSFADTGVTINQRPQVRMDLRIEPVDGSEPFEGVKTTTISRLTPPYEGQRFPVWYDREDPTNFVIGLTMARDAKPEVRRLFELAASQDPGRPGEAGAAPGGAAGDTLAQLERLNGLREAGALTEDEFNQQKARLLDSE